MLAAPLEVLAVKDEEVMPEEADCLQPREDAALPALRLALNTAR